MSLARQKKKILVIEYATFVNFLVFRILSLNLLYFSYYSIVENLNEPGVTIVGIYGHSRVQVFANFTTYYGAGLTLGLTLVELYLSAG